MTSKTLTRFIPPRYIVSSIICAGGGFIYGFDTGIIGPTTVMADYTTMFGHPSSAVHGIIVSCILLSASVSSFFAGRLADVLGRPRALALGAAIFAVGAAIQASAVHIAMFAAGRVIEGLGEGLYFGTQTIYISEISPPHMRGSLTSGPQFMICTALAIGYFTCYGTANIADSMSWRLPFIILAGLSLLYALAALLLLPASPRWLISQGRDAEAEKVWDVLGVERADRQDLEAETSDDALSDDCPERHDGHKAESNASFRELFARDVRKRTMLAVFLMGFLQLSGIDAVLYYAPLLFQQAGLQSSEASFLASGVSGIVIIAASIPAMLFADRWGRRTITMFGGVGMTITMLIMAGIYAGKAVHPHSGGGRWVAIVCIYLYSVLFATTWAISIKVYAPEIQPQRTRAQATSLAHGANWVCNFLVAFLCPILLDKSSSAAYFLFGSCTLLTTIVCFFYMVETKGRLLGEIERAFAGSEMRRRSISTGMSKLPAVRSSDEEKQM